jgi:hypothetical protein
MQTPLTIQIVVKNNEETIEHTLESLIPLKSKILIGDLGCKDETINKCRKHNAKIIPVSFNNDFSKVRNYLLKHSDSKWNFYIEPWEVIMNGHEAIQETLIGPQIAYKLNLIQGDVITKQIRLWHNKTGLEFKNPVFETITGESKDIASYIAIGSNKNANIYLDIVEKWREKFAGSDLVTYLCTRF